MQKGSALFTTVPHQNYKVSLDHDGFMTGNPFPDRECELFVTGFSPSGLLSGVQDSRQWIRVKPSPDTFTRVCDAYVRYFHFLFFRDIPAFLGFSEFSRIRNFVNFRHFWDFLSSPELEISLISGFSNSPDF